MPNRFGVALLAAALIIACAVDPVAGARSRRKAASADPTPVTRPTPQLRARLDRLEAEIAAGEDLRAIQRLQRAYGYYLDKGMWEDVAALFTDDAVGNYPEGTFVGKTSIRQHLYMNVGGGKVGDLGFPDGRLYNHMQLQPVVHLDPGGRTAKGRWRSLAMLGTYGSDATWTEGVYEIGYVKDRGVWKIRTLDYYAGFAAPYQSGWVVPETPRAAPAGGRILAHPADREHKADCDGFPAVCVAPFHYENLGTNAAAAMVWNTSGMVAATKSGDVVTRAQSLAHRAMFLEDGQKIENLQRIYGYYIDRGLWDQAATLFAADSSFETGQSGVYLGKKRIRQFLALAAPHGLEWGHLNDHLQLQPIVDIAPSGLTARARSRELGMTGQYGGKGTWSEGVYENTYVKQGGVWKFRSLHFYPTFISDYNQGWAKNAQPAPLASAQLPPDKPSTDIYDIYPKAHVTPFHYRNPVTGEPPHYPQAGGPTPELAASSLMPTAYKPRRLKPDDAEAITTATERRIGRVKDYYELENLESAYGYYFDQNLFNNLADLFATDGTLELAQRGLYRGRDRVRAFLLHTYTHDGKEGPVAGQLNNHIQLQPVIDVAEDGQSARIRSRTLQQTSFGSRASIGGAVHENEAVKENGIWKFKTSHAYNTFTAGYDGGWAKNPDRDVAGSSADLPPDAAPTQVFDLFPVVYEVPFHYVNPVTGAPAMKTAAPIGMPPRIATALREIGPRIEAVKTAELYAPLQPKEPYLGVQVTRDLHYGPDERNVLDVFVPAPPAAPAGSAAGSARAMLVFVHGGGFSRGVKHAPGSFAYDNIGLWAADHGLIGVTINYRLAPQFPWPAGIEDMALVVSWLQAHAAEYGGDPNKIVLWGHSAGAAHVGDYVAHQSSTGADTGIAGAILTSGIYDLGDKASPWKGYYGDDVSLYPQRSSLAPLLKTTTPLFVTYAELDPESFQADSIRLILGRAAGGIPVRNLRLPGHSHISETFAVGSGDESLSAPVLDFVHTVPAHVPVPLPVEPPAAPAAKSGGKPSSKADAKKSQGAK